MSVSDRIAAYWPFDSTHGRTATFEYTGTYTIDGGTAGTAAGKVRQALSLEADNSEFRSVSDAAGLRQLKGCTVWVKLESKAADMSIVAKGSTSANADHSIRLWYDQSEDVFSYTVGDDTTATTVSTTGLTISTDTWYFIRCATDGERQTIWVDETLYGAADYRAPFSETGTFYIGRDTSGNYFDGLIDELAVYSTAPTRSDGAVFHNGGDGISLPEFDELPGPSGRGGFCNRWKPPTFAESDDGVLYVAHGKRRVQAFDGYGSFRSAGVPSPSSAPTLDSSGTGRIIGDLYGYVRFLDADGRVSSMSPISDVLRASGDSRGAITGATNAAPIVITSASHGLSTGTRVRVTGQQGNTAANGVWYVTRINADEFSLDGSVGNGDWIASEAPTLVINKVQTGRASANEVQSVTLGNMIGQCRVAATGNVSFSVSNGWDISTTAYDGKSYDSSSETGTVRDAVFKSDGSKMYLAKGASIYQYSLSTPWDVSSAAYDSKSFDFSTTSEVIPSALAIAFRSDGSRVFVLAALSVVHGYNLGTAWDISTVQTGALSYDASAEGTSGTALRFNATGTAMFLADSTTDDVFQYTLSSAWAIATSSYASKLLDVSGQEGTVRGIEFGDSGTTLYVVGPGNDTIYQYTLTTPYDVSTGAYASKSFDVSSQVGLSNSVSFNSDGTRVFVADLSGTTIYQYEVGTATDPNPVDGITLNDNDRVLLPLQTDASENGTYVAVDADDPRKWTRTTDMAAGSHAADVLVFVTAGTANANTLWHCSTDYGVDVVGTDDLTWADETGSFGGSSTYTINGQTTASVAYNASASTFQSALEVVLGSGNVTCGSGPLNEAPVSVTFTGDYAGIDMPLITATSSITGPVTTVTVAQTTQGVSARNTIQQISASNLSAGAFTLTRDSRTTATIEFDTVASGYKTALELLSTIDTVTVTGDALTEGVIRVEFTGADASSDVSLMTADVTELYDGGWATGASEIEYTNVAVPTDTRVTRKQILRTKPGNADVAYIDVDTTDISLSSFVSTNTDEDLTAATLVVLRDSDGVDHNLNRHDEPPDWKTSISAFQNRLFVAGDYIESAGAVQIDGTDADGIATDWPSIFDTRSVYGESASDGYVIDTMDPDDQQVTLTDNGETTSSTGDYRLLQAPPENQRLYHSWLTASDAYPESFYLLGPFQVARDTRDGAMVGTFSFDGRLFIAFENTIYRYSFETDPAQAPVGDGRAAVAVPRGLVNLRCVAYADDIVYCLDHQGIYRFDGSAVEGVSQVLKPMFVGEHSAYNINWRYADFFHAAYFPSDRTVRFWVVLGGGPYPQHAICLNIDTGAWWLEHYPYAITASTTALIDGELRVLLGASGRRIFTLDGSREGTRSATDVVRGTATSAGISSLTDSGAAFTSSLVGLPVEITEGTGRGQRRIISSVTSTTLYVAGEWGVRPSTDSVYQVGGVSWSVRTGKLRYTDSGKSEVRGVEVVWTPVSNSQTLAAVVRQDFSVTGQTAQMTRAASDADGFSVTAGDPHFTLNMTRDGTATFRISGQSRPNTSSPALLDVEVDGVTNGERHELHVIAVSGAT